jgi:hypothetical protein
MYGDEWRKPYFTGRVMALNLSVIPTMSRLMGLLRSLSAVLQALFIWLCYASVEI